MTRFTVRHVLFCPLTVLLALWSSLGLRQTASGQTKPQAPSLPTSCGAEVPRTSPYYFLFHQEWLTEAWRGNDAPYAAARISINNQFAHGDPTQLVAALGTKAASSPNDPLAQFKYSYAYYYLTVKIHGEPSLPFVKCDSLEDALSLPISPHCYDYDRLRLLLTTGLQGPEDIPMATRVYLRDPTDRSNRVLYVNSLLSGTISQVAMAMAAAESLCKTYPNDSHVFAILAAVQRGMWYRNKDSEEAYAAVENYQKYLQMAPPDDPFRPEAVLLISDLQRRANLQ